MNRTYSVRICLPGEVWTGPNWENMETLSHIGCSFFCDKSILIMNSWERHKKHIQCLRNTNFLYFLNPARFNPTLLIFRVAHHQPEDCERDAGLLEQMRHLQERLQNADMAREAAVVDAAAAGIRRGAPNHRRAAQGF